MMHTLTCPHPDCGGTFQVERKQLNCGIFRHGIFRKTGRQIPQHANEAQCRKWIDKDKIWGCGKPFRVLRTEDGTLRAEICDYL